MEATPKKKPNRFLSIAFLLLMIGATVYIVFRDTSLSDVWSTIVSVDPFWLSLAAAASLFSTFLLGYALFISLRRLCGQRVSLRRCLDYALVGSYYSAITPSSTGGQPMQLYEMCAGDDGLDVSHASLALLLVNVAYQTAVLLLPAGLTVLRFRFVTENVHGFQWFLLFGIFVSLFIILFIVFAMFSKTFVYTVCHGVIHFLHRIHIVKNEEKVLAKADAHIGTYRAGAKTFLSKPLVFVEVFLVYLVQMCALFSISYFVYRAFGLSEYALIDVLALQSVLYLAVCFLPVPGGAGATETAFLSLFRTMFPSGMIVSAMLLSRLVSFYLILLISGVSCVALQLRRSRHAAPPAPAPADPPEAPADVPERPADIP